MKRDAWYRMMWLPESGRTERARTVSLWVIVPFLVVTLASLIAAPVPAWVLGPYVLLGAAIGALWAPRLLLLSGIGLVVFLLAAPVASEAVRSRAVQRGIAWQGRWEWQPILVSWSLVALFVSVPLLLAKARKKVRTGTE
jgi:hypothetical protein